MQFMQEKYQNVAQLSQNSFENKTHFCSDSPYNLTQHTKATHIGHWTAYETKLKKNERKTAAKSRTLTELNFVASHSDKLNLSLMHQIIVSNLPFAFVDHVSTIEHYKIVAPSFSLNSRTWFQQVRNVVNR